jgi:hypothetical protein
VKEFAVSPGHIPPYHEAFFMFATKKNSWLLSCQQLREWSFKPKAGFELWLEHKIWLGSTKLTRPQLNWNQLAHFARDCVDGH